ASQSFFFTTTAFSFATRSMIKNPMLCRVRSYFPGFPRPTTNFTDQFPKTPLTEFFWAPRPLPSVLLAPLLSARRLLQWAQPSVSEPLQPSAAPRSRARGLTHKLPARLLPELDLLFKQNLRYRWRSFLRR